MASANAVDRQLDTRWASGHEQAPIVTHAWWPQWLAVDLGAEYTICQVRITWEDAYAASYEIQGRRGGGEEDDEWRTLNSVDAAWPGEVVTAMAEGCVARELRVKCLRRGTEWGYSIRRLAVYGAVPTTE